MNIIRNFNDWEVARVASFFECLYSHVSFRNGADRIGWRLKRDGVFDIRSYYSALRGSQPMSFFFISKKILLKEIGLEY